MRTHAGILVAVAAFVAAPCVATAQQPPVLRALGPIVRVSTEPLASVATVVPLRDGRVYVNDITAHRVVLLDSTLAKAVVVADSTGATANAYGARPGTLVAYRADTALFIDPASLSMLVLSPDGKIVRVMAIPRPGDAPFLIGSIYGTPGFDARGRLTYYAAGRSGVVAATTSGPQMIPQSPDSAFVVRVDLATRVLDTAASFKVPKLNVSTIRDEHGVVTSLRLVPTPLPVVDDWTVCPDGSIAVVRGRDYHIDWLSGDGSWTSTAKMPFEWQHLDDDQKLAVIDSSMQAEQARADAAIAGLKASVASGAASGGGRGATRGGGASPPLPTVGRPELSDIADYRPPFSRAAVRADADGNLWIRTTTIVKGQPVYDIVNRRGQLFDRVQLPPFRTIAGFGPGSVYMAVKDSAGVVHVERARVK